MRDTTAAAFAEHRRVAQEAADAALAIAARDRRIRAAVESGRPPSPGDLASIGDAFAQNWLQSDDPGVRREGLDRLATATAKAIAGHRQAAQDALGAARRVIDAERASVRPAAPQDATEALLAETRAQRAWDRARPVLERGAATGDPIDALRRVTAEVDDPTVFAALADELPAWARAHDLDVARLVDPLLAEAEARVFPGLAETAPFVAQLDVGAQVVDTNLANAERYATGAADYALRGTWPDDRGDPASVKVEKVTA